MTAFVAVMVVVMVFVPMTVLADSPVVSATVIDEAKSSLPTGAQLVYTTSVASGDVATLQAAAQSAGLNGAASSGMFDISLEDGQGNATQLGADGYIYVDAPGVKAGDKVTILHVKADGSVETLYGAAGDGYFTFYCADFSPFAFYVTRASAATGGGTTTATSPTTGVYA